MGGSSTLIIARKDNISASFTHQAGVLKMVRNLTGALLITRAEHVTADIFRIALNMPFHQVPPKSFSENYSRAGP